jgi:hypothetical protein
MSRRDIVGAPDPWPKLTGKDDLDSEFAAVGGTTEFSPKQLLDLHSIAAVVVGREFFT